MTSLFTAAILGVVEGLTEFLPVSSTGHLIITGHLLGFTGEKAASFEVAIQLGAILAVVVLYWSRFWGLIVPPQGQRFSGIRGLYMLFLTSLPASFLGLLTHSYIKEHLFNPNTVAWALGVGAIMILIVEKKIPDQIASLWMRLLPNWLLASAAFNAWPFGLDFHVPLRRSWEECFWEPNARLLLNIHSLLLCPLCLLQPVMICLKVINFSQARISPFLQLDLSCPFYRHGLR